MNHLFFFEKRTNPPGRGTSTALVAVALHDGGGGGGGGGGTRPDGRVRVAPQEAPARSCSLPRARPPRRAAPVCVRACERTNARGRGLLGTSPMSSFASTDFVGTPETDAILMQLAQRSGDLDSLLRSFFGFLHRKTDLYIEQRGESFAMGFAPGDAEKKVLQAFRGFPTKSGGDLRIKKRPSASATASSPPPSAQGAGKMNDKARLVEVESTAPADSVGSSSTSSAAETPANSASDSSSSARSASSNIPRVRLTEEGKQIPVGNGGVTDRYYWTQTLTELTVYVAVPPGTRAKQIAFKVTPREISLTLKSGGPDGGPAPVLVGKMGGLARHHEAVWTLEERQTVIITLEKAQETWWECVVEGDAVIDTTKVDSKRAVSDYDAVTQGHIRKIMFDQRQKMKGLPTSDEMKQHEILERAKNLPNSPFRQDYVQSQAAAAASTVGSGGPEQKKD